MAALISPGVSVSVTDESAYASGTSATVPLIILATAENKKQLDGTSAAIGTLESNVVRSVSSLTQSLQLYGVPRFLESVSGEPFHGDARNEYGLLALNQFLGIGSRALVVRANVNLNDDRSSVLSNWMDAINTASINLQTAADAFIANYNTSHSYISSDSAYKTTVTRTELVALINQVLVAVYASSYNYGTTLFGTNFTANKNPTLGGAASFNVYNSGFTAIVDQFMGVIGAALDWETNHLGSVTGKESEWSSVEAAAFLIDQADDYAFTTQFVNVTSLGANDAARRSAIVTALQATANRPELRAEQNEFNIILCPGYYELADEMAALQLDVMEEAIVIAETPMNKDADALVTWAESSSAGRIYSHGVAYYYAHGLASNIDGKDVLAAASGIALRVYAYSDNQSDVWWAPAGTNRGVVTGVSQMGYYSGTPGTATTFVEATLNSGQRDNLYKDGTNINPITFLPGRGIIVMGQKTSASVTSAFDRVNVVRLLAHIRRNLRKSSFAFVFQPNDQLTRDDLKAMVDGFLGGLIARRGLYDFATQCDSNNNTPDRIDRSELWINIALKPVKAAEFVYIPIRVVATGADL
jgi:phage tail sheath protein FI